MTNVMISEQEIWKDIPGYEGLYQASSFGIIRSFDRRVNATNGCFRVIKGRTLKPWLSNKGYWMVELFDSGGNPKRLLVHTLILITFKGERPKDNVGMHINDTPTDNRVVNLKWGTQRENIRECHAKGRNAKPLNTKPVEAVCLKTGTRLVFYSRTEAVRRLGAKNINKVLSGERPHCKNYSFKYLP